MTQKFCNYALHNKTFSVVFLALCFSCSVTELSSFKDIFQNDHPKFSELKKYFVSAAIELDYFGLENANMKSTEKSKTRFLEQPYAHIISLFTVLATWNNLKSITYLTLLNVNFRYIQSIEIFIPQFSSTLVNVFNIPDWGSQTWGEILQGRTFFDFPVSRHWT